MLILKSSIQKIGVYDYSDGAANYIEWATDGNLGSNLTINHILELNEVSVSFGLDRQVVTCGCQMAHRSGWTVL